MRVKVLQKSNDQQQKKFSLTKIAVGSSMTLDVSTAPADTVPPRKDSYISLIYGRLLETKETEELCKRLGMNREDVRNLRRKFDEEDGSNSDTVTIRGFFHLINDDSAYERAHLLTKELLRLGYITTPVTRITFDQFLCIVCTFAAFSDLQLWRFYYDSFFADGIDTVSAHRLNEILQAAGGTYTQNIEVAARNFTATAVAMSMSSCLTFDEFLELVRRNPVVFYPLVQLQRNIRSRTLGERYWEKKVREQVLVPPLVEYIRLHQGHLPPMGFKNWMSSLLTRGNTVVARARALAKQQYSNNVR
ncbi:unnamed protein product [Phytophthora fragariaefolia]|uniref:Unnamed protein product n=1 Tax=Phytophthora fragariaefolia TaxID=1490495 RepID=A0A9W6XFW4_9STRA|nr:unnamed protein product [Phytophthora fragariaefolia]